MKFRSKNGKFIISEGNDVFYVGDDFSKALSVMNSQLPDDELDDESDWDLSAENSDDNNLTELVELENGTYKTVPIPEDENDLFDELCNLNLED